MKTSPVMIVRIPCPGNTSIKIPDSNNKIPKKFFVIGSNSFSGSHFVNQLLLKGNQVCGVSRSAEPDKVFLPYKWGENIVHINDSKKTIDNFMVNNTIILWIKGF